MMNLYGKKIAVIYVYDIYIFVESRKRKINKKKNKLLRIEQYDVSKTIRKKN